MSVTSRSTRMRRAFARCDASAVTSARRFGASKRPPERTAERAQQRLVGAAADRDRVEDGAAQLLAGLRDERVPAGLAPGRAAVADVHDLERAGLRGRAVRGVAERQRHVAGAVGLQAARELQRRRHLVARGGDERVGVLAHRDVGGRHQEAVGRPQALEHDRERLQLERAALERAARVVEQHQHAPRAGDRVGRRGDARPVGTHADGGVGRVLRLLAQRVRRPAVLRRGRGRSPSCPGTTSRPSARRRRASGGTRGRSDGAFERVHVAPPARLVLERRHVADDDALLRLRLDREDAELEDACRPPTRAAPGRACCRRSARRSRCAFSRSTSSPSTSSPSTSIASPTSTAPSGSGKRNVPCRVSSVGFQKTCSTRVSAASPPHGRVDGEAPQLERMRRRRPRPSPPGCRRPDAAASSHGASRAPATERAPAPRTTQGLHHCTSIAATSSGLALLVRADRGAPAASPAPCPRRSTTVTSPRASANASRDVP